MDLYAYGVSAIVYFVLTDIDTGEFLTGASHASGDTVIIKDGGSPASTTNGFVEEGNGWYSLTLTSSEMEAKVVALSIVDQSTKVWMDNGVKIGTHSHASALMPFNLGSATPDVNVAQISGDSTAADNCEAMFDGTGYAGGTIRFSSVDVTAISGDTTAANNLEAAFDGTGYEIPGLITRLNTATASAAGTLTLDAGAPATTDYYKDQWLVIVSGTGAGQARLITGYSTGRVATVSHNWATTPSSTAVFAIIPAARMDLGLIGGSAISTTTAQLGVNVVQISADATAADNLEAAYDDTAGSVRWNNIIDQGTAQSVTGSTIVLRAAAAFADDELIGNLVLITSATTGAGQVRRITDYVSTTDTATVEPNWTTNPTGTIVYKILPASYRVQADVIAVSGDTGAADNLEAAYDGAGYAGGTIKQVVDVGAISGDTGAADNLEAAYDGAGYAGGTIKQAVDVVAISGSATAADNLELGALAIVPGTAITGTLSSTQATTDLTEATDEHYVGRALLWRSGLLANSATTITAYNGTTKLLTYDATPTGESPSNGDAFIIV